MKMAELEGNAEVGAGAMARDPELPNDYDSIAGIIADLIRNPKTDRAEAVALLTQALRMAHSGGAAQAANEVGNSMLKTFDEATR